MRMRILLAAGAWALVGAALMLAACVGGAGGGGPVSAIDNYCAASTPQARQLLRLPLLSALDLPADTGELFCLDGPGGGVIVAPAPAGPQVIVPPAVTPGRALESRATGSYPGPPLEPRAGSG